MAAPALSSFLAIRGGGQAQKCDLAAVASSLLLCVPALCVLCKEMITERRKKSWVFLQGVVFTSLVTVKNDEVGKGRCLTRPSFNLKVEE